MATGMWGADVEALEDLGRLFLARSEDIRRAHGDVRQLLARVPWQGADSDMHMAQWDGSCRAQIELVSRELQNAGDSLLGHAREQRWASDDRRASTTGGDTRFGGGRGGSSVATEPHALRRFSDAMLTTSDGVAPLGEIAKVGGLVFGSSGVALGGSTIAWFGYAADGSRVAADLRDGSYEDAAAGGAILTGEIAAGKMKTLGPKGYLGGAALQTGMEIAKESREMDWSSEGMAQLRDASLSDWGDAYLDACTQMPGKLWSIFKPY